MTARSLPMRALGLSLAFVLISAGGAQAKREQVFAYPYSRVWTAALRMVRVDFASPITEKDSDAGYFLFDFPNNGRSYAGSVEVVRVVERGMERARVVVQVPEMPSYFEQLLLDKLTRKLGAEYGQPVEPKPEAPAAPPTKDEGQAGQGESKAPAKAPADKSGK
jgi:hypothetical protein